MCNRLHLIFFYSRQRRHRRDTLSRKKNRKFAKFTSNSAANSVFLGDFQDIGCEKPKIVFLVFSEVEKMNVPIFSIVFDKSYTISIFVVSVSVNGVYSGLIGF